jgi:AcrR family transcriptional regulator
VEQNPASRPQTAPPGRPRSEPARRAVLDAALRLARRDGYAAVTIKGIAEEAHVGRQTVYRWWTSRAAILLEAVGELAQRTVAPEPGSDPAEDLRRLLRSTFLLAQEVGSVVVGLMADAAGDAEFLAALQEQLLVPRRAVVNEILERAQRSGRFADGFDTALVTDMIWGTMWYRLLSRHAPVDERLADELTDAAVRLLGTAGQE